MKHIQIDSLWAQEMALAVERMRLASMLVLASFSSSKEQVPHMTNDMNMNCS
jgi:hypothetical protein